MVHFPFCAWKSSPFLFFGWNIGFLGASSEKPNTSSKSKQLTNRNSKEVFPCIFLSPSWVSSRTQTSKTRMRFYATHANLPPLNLIFCEVTFSAKSVSNRANYSCVSTSTGEEERMTWPEARKERLPLSKQHRLRSAQVSHGNHSLSAWAQLSWKLNLHTSRGKADFLLLFLQLLKRQQKATKTVMGGQLLQSLQCIQQQSGLCKCV